MKPVLFLLLLTISANAAGTLLDRTFVVSTTIPDNNIIGLADTRAVTSAITSITTLEVAVTLTGGWNGDLYAYLSHAGGFSILLNRPGRSLSFPDGSGSSGMDVLFTDAAVLDLHTSIPATGPVAGIYQPDARNVDPAGVLDTSPRTAFLGSFTGLDPNGDWTLFLADTSPGSTAVLQSWGLKISGVPEPSSGLLVLGGALLLLKRRR